MDAGRVAPMAWRIDAAGGVLVPQSIRFDARAFDPVAFAHAGIPCPPQIAGAVRKRQAEFYFGRLCAQAGLAGLGIAAPVGIGPAREPVWPAGVMGSITHSDAIAAAVVLPGRGCGGVGLDIEALPGDPATIDALRSTVVSPAELQCLARYETLLGPDMPLVLAFSAKESFFKAMFGTVQRYIDFDAIELEALDERAGVLVFRLREHLSARWPAGARCAVHFRLLDARHVATLCAW